jgi:hypothetical protein
LATKHEEYIEHDFSHYQCLVVDSRSCVKKLPLKYYKA